MVPNKNSLFVLITHLPLALPQQKMLQSSNKYAATAGVLSEFLPVLDRLTSLREQYGEDEFGRKYAALAGGMRTAFSDLGVTEYTVSPGDSVEADRVVAIASEHSDAIEVHRVLRPIAVGMELQGNVVRPAECVASLGVEQSVAAVEDTVEPEDAATAADQVE